MAGDLITVRVQGTAKCLAGDVVTINGNVMIEVTTGRVVNASGATAKSLGVAMQAAADGDLFEVELAHLPNSLGPTA